MNHLAEATEHARSNGKCSMSVENVDIEGLEKIKGCSGNKCKSQACLKEKGQDKLTEQQQADITRLEGMFYEDENTHNFVPIDQTLARAIVLKNADTRNTADTMKTNTVKKQQTQANILREVEKREHAIRNPITTRVPEAQISR